jgi:hypothetical protein
MQQFSWNSMDSKLATIISDNNLTPTLYEDAAVKVITWVTNNGSRMMMQAHSC